MLGGNRFIGKHIANKLIDYGYDVTVLNRTGTGPEMATHIKCNRDDVYQLKQCLHKPYNIIIDMCGYNERQIRELEESLNTLPDYYVFMSTLAAGKSEFGEYGTNKKHAEDYLFNKSKLKFTIVQPGYIIGAGDPYNRIQLYINQLKNHNLELPYNPHQPIVITESQQLITELFRLITVQSNLFMCDIFKPSSITTSPNQIANILAEHYNIPLSYQYNADSQFNIKLEDNNAVDDYKQTKKILESYANQIS